MEVSYAANVPNGRDRAACADLLSVMGAETIMLTNFIPLLGSFLGSGLMTTCFYPVMCLAFVATVPCLIRKFWR